MENNENMEIVAEAVENVAEAAPKGGHLVKNLVTIGGIATTGILGWEFVLKPIGKKIKKAWTERKAKKQAKKAENDKIDVDEIVHDIENGIED